MSKGCDNPSKWGLQQPEELAKLLESVVITPQNGVFNNRMTVFLAALKL